MTKSPQLPRARASIIIDLRSSPFWATGRTRESPLICTKNSYVTTRSLHPDEGDTLILPVGILDSTLIAQEQNSLHPWTSKITDYFIITQHAFHTQLKFSLADPNRPINYGNPISPLCLKDGNMRHDPPFKYTAACGIPLKNLPAISYTRTLFPSMSNSLLLLH